MSANNNETLKECSFLPHNRPKKLIFLLHGYGDNADNFIHIAGNFSHEELNANYFALNAPNLIANYPTGREWFNLYPNNIQRCSSPVIQNRNVYLYHPVPVSQK